VVCRLHLYTKYETLVIPAYIAGMQYNMSRLLPSSIVKKVKAIPFQAWTGPDAFRRMRFPDFIRIGT